MTIHVVLPVHNRKAMTLGFLDSLDAQDVDETIEVLVVDDGSTDGTEAALLQRQRDGRRHHHITYLSGNGSLWWAGAVAKAVAYLRDRVQPDDWVYLGNNDTVLATDHLAFLLDTARSHPDTLVGARAFEIWQDGHRHPVSAGFFIDPQTLEVSNLPGTADGVTDVDALAGRGVLIPASALAHIRMHPDLMPQHFADISMTSALRRQGFALKVDHRAQSDQTERAGSSIEFKPRMADFMNKRSQLYLPAVLTFWWLQSAPEQRVTLPFRFLARGARQTRAGHYTVR